MITIKTNTWEKLVMFNRNLIVGLLLWAVSTSSYAFNVRTCQGESVKWLENSVRVGVSTTSFPPGSPWRAALQTAAGRFNTNPSEGMLFLHSDSRVGLANGENEAWVTTNAAVPQLGNYAGTATYIDCWSGFGVTLARIREADILFNAARTWSPSENKSTLSDYGGEGSPMIMIAMHEMGHVMGLLDLSSRDGTEEYSLMFGESKSLYVNGAMARAYVGEDTGAGAMFLYGQRSSAPRDVSVSHWRMDRHEHRRTRLFDESDGWSRPPSESGDEGSVYRVNQGQTVHAEFTYENNGPADELGVDLGFYLSTDDYISTDDLLLRRIWVDLHANSDAYTKRYAVTIPSSVPIGKYWLGVVVDDLEQIPESTSLNNATYIPVRVCRKSIGCFWKLPEIPAPTPPGDLD